MINFSDEFNKRIAGSKKILLVGAGGGFDILSCLPLYYKLISEQKEVYLANFSHLLKEELEQVTDFKEMIENQLYMVGSNIKSPAPHYPSGMVSLWLEQTYNEQVPIYLVTKGQNVSEIQQSYAMLHKELGYDTVIACGFGMRSVMLGDEEGCGDMLHSTMNLGAIHRLEGVDNKLIVTFGIESTNRSPVSLQSAYENIAFNVQSGGYLGVSDMGASDSSFQYMKHCYDFIAATRYHDRSEIIEMIIMASFGKIGRTDNGMVTPFMSHIHSFDLNVALSMNKILPHIEELMGYDEIVQKGMSLIKGNKIRPYTPIQI